MGTHTGSVMTLANSIIGVSVLAMPFCFKQCGIILSIVMLILSNVVTRLACYYLIKSAIMEKRKNFEMLAFRVLGRSGKLTVELCIIGFMLGTCVAFFVVVGDLGPTILAEVIGVEHPSALRPSVLIGLGVFVVLPLGLLRNVESLSMLCAASIAFYFCLVLKVMGEATSHLLAWDWMDKVSFWRPAGVLQCIPIFSMALSCQTQLFEVFDSLPSTPMERMNSIIRSAINMTTTFYIAVGFFGYVAFCNQPFTGNLLINLSPSVLSYVIKLGFVLSVAVSFPLVIFPCRASIYSLIFTSGSLTGGGEGSSHIPETKFQCITLLIVTASLVTGLLVPSIEAVLGFVGSTIGVLVCIILPSVIFICLSNKNTSERLLAKMLAAMGMITMVLSTYANLTAVDNTQSALEFPVVPEIPVVLAPIHKDLDVVGVPQVVVQLPDKLIQPDIPPNKLTVREEDMKKLKDIDELKKLVQPKLQEAKLETKFKEKIEDINKEEKSRQEPPNPVPDEPKVPPKKKKTGLVPPLSKLEDRLPEKKIDIEEIRKSIEKLNLPKSVEVEKVEEKLVLGSGKEEKVIRIEKMSNISEAIIVTEPIKRDSPNVTTDFQNSVLAKSIANGVPLPLAIKGSLDKEKKFNIKDREKRDTLTEISEIGLKTEEIKEKPVEMVNRDVLLVTDNKVLSPSVVSKDGSFVKAVEKEVKSISDNEKCPKNETEIPAPLVGLKETKIETKEISIDPEPTSNAIKNPVTETNPNQKNLLGENPITTKPSLDKNELIKTPAYLSDPNLFLYPIKAIHGPEPNLNLEPNPLKRDLKSVPNNFDINKIEHR